MVPAVKFLFSPSWAPRLVEITCAEQSDAKARALVIDPACRPRIVGMRWWRDEVGPTTFTVELASRP